MDAGTQFVEQLTPTVEYFASKCWNEEREDAKQNMWYLAWLYFNRYDPKKSKIQTYASNLFRWYVKHSISVGKERRLKKLKTITLFHIFGPHDSLENLRLEQS